MQRAKRYEINELAKEEPWRLFRILAELIDGFDILTGVEPAVTIFGSSRMKPDNPDYEKTRLIANLLGQEGFSIITGGGPGVMEAANLGAKEAGARSIGLNIELPQGQGCNVYATENFTFNHFFVRKVMLVKYATAFIFIPGGLGTLDELTEVLTLIQTGKVKPFPVILIDTAYWQGFMDWLRNYSLASGYISESDLQLLRVTDDPAEAVDIVKKWYLRQAITGRKAV